MANYTGNPNNFFSSTNSFSYFDNDLNWDLTNPFMANTISTCFAPNSNLDYQSLMGVCNDQISTHQTSHLLHAKLFGNSNTQQIRTSASKDQVSHQVDSSVVVVSPNGHECISASPNKRKAENFAESSTSLYSSSAIPNDRVKKKNELKQKTGKGKRSKTSDKEEDNHREVVHVRARRGQATDSHSIAERVRRGKINERLRCLQDIVPGCCKTMGMAVMLDEIINYVQSLQNQVEFLSMKLTAASQFHDFNSECEHVEKKQKIKAWSSEEEQDIQMITSKGGYDEALLPNFNQSAGWPF